jgi:hypothetical protein
MTRSSSAPTRRARTRWPSAPASSPSTMRTCACWAACRPRWVPPLLSHRRAHPPAPYLPPPPPGVQAEPKATEYIPQMISTIGAIISNGHAYAVEGGDVFFDVGSLPGYGRLSGRAQVSPSVQGGGEQMRCYPHGKCRGGGEQMRCYPHGKCRGGSGADALETLPVWCQQSTMGEHRAPRIGHKAACAMLVAACGVLFWAASLTLLAGVLAGGQPRRRACGGGPAQAQRRRLCPVEGGQARGTQLGQSLGGGQAG